MDRRRRYRQHMAAIAAPAVASGEACVTPPALAANLTAANSEYFSVASNATLQTGDVDWTWAGWTYFDTGQNVVVSKRAAFPNDIEYELAWEGGRLKARISDGTSSWQTPALGAGGQLGAWWHLQVRYDSSANTLSIRGNDGTGNGSEESVATAHDGTYTNATAVALGGLPSGGQTIDGRLQCWGFWKRKLSTDELDALYNTGTPVAYCALTDAQKVNLVSYWNLDEESDGSGAVTRNDSHGTNHLTDNNTVPSIAWDS